MRKQVILCVMATVLLLGERAQATSFRPYREERVTDSNGRYYVVVRRREGLKQEDGGGPVTLTIAQRREGSPPVRGASAEPVKVGGFYVPTQDPEIRVRDGDTVHGRVDLDRPPGDILVSSTGNGIATIDAYGFNNGLGPEQDDLVVFSIKGEVLHRKRRKDLFDEATRRRFSGDQGVFAWLRTSWLDEKRDDIVIFGFWTQDGKPLPILTVGLTSGEVRQGGTEVIDRAICERNLDALSRALGLALELKLTGSKACLPAILEDEKIALVQRLQAAVLLASLGDPRGASLLTKTALRIAQVGSPRYDRDDGTWYAVMHLPELLGEDALPILKKTLQNDHGFYDNEHVHAFKLLGRRAVPTLISVLEDDRFLDAQLTAASCLGEIGPEAAEAVPALIKALRKKRGVKSGILFFRLDSHAAGCSDVWARKQSLLFRTWNDSLGMEIMRMRESARRALTEIRGHVPQQ